MRSSQEIESNSFRNKEGAVLTTETLKIDEKYTKEAIPFGWKIFKSADPSPYSDNLTHGSCWKSEKLARNANKCEIIELQYPVYIKKYGLIEQDTEPGAEKIVIESVSSEDSRDRARFIVKDICVDEDTNIDTKILVESNGTTEVLITRWPLRGDNDGREGRKTNGLSISVFDEDVPENISYRNPKKLEDEVSIEVSSKRVAFDEFLGCNNALELDYVQQTLDKKMEESACPSFSASSLAEENYQRINGVHHSREETVSSIPISLSEPGTSSGRIMPFIGSISHRSDSSTTSTRSFAFPILQSEWNSSPVKMAKANRRHLRRRACWRMGLFCCRS